MSKIEEHPRRDIPEPAPTSRKEDYKAHTERDLEEGWPYSDEPGREEDRLQRNRPYAAEETDSGIDVSEAEYGGFHVEEIPLAAEEAEAVADLTGEERRTRAADATADESADPEGNSKDR